MPDKFMLMQSRNCRIVFNRDRQGIISVSDGRSISTDSLLSVIEILSTT